MKKLGWIIVLLFSVNYLNAQDIQILQPGIYQTDHSTNLLKSPIEYDIICHVPRNSTIEVISSAEKGHYYIKSLLSD